MKTPRRPARRILGHSLARCSSVLAVAVALAPSLSAVVVNWDPAGNQSNSGGLGTWDTTSLFWNDDNAAPNLAWPNTNADAAIFGGFGGAVTIDTAANTGVVANALTFNVTGYDIAASEPAEVLTLAGTTPTIAVTNAFELATISARVAGVDGLRKTGDGTLVLAVANSFTGGLSINAGAVRGVGAAALTSAALGAGPVIFNSGNDFTPSLELRNNGQPFPNIAQAGVAGVIGLGQVPSTITYGNDVLIGPGTFNFGIDVANNGANTGQQMVLGALNVSRPVQLNVTGANNYSLRFASVALADNLTVNPTTAPLRLDNIGETGGARTITMLGTGELQLGGNSTFTGGVNVTAGTLRLLPTIGTVFRPQGTGPLVLPASGTLGISSRVGTLTSAGATPGALTAKFYQLPAAGGINTSPFFAPPSGVLTVTRANDATFFNRPPGVTAGAYTNGVVVYSGLLNITTAGDYTFQTAIDDQSQLVIDGQPIISVNTASGGTTLVDSPVSPTLTLAAGLHTITMKALNNGGAGGFRVSYNGPDSGGTMRLIAPSAFLAPLPYTNVGGAGVSRTIGAGDFFTLDGGGTDLDGGLDALTFAGSGTLNVTNSGGTGAMTVTGTTTLQASPIFNPTTGILALLGDVADSGGPFPIAKTGGGTLVLAGAKTFGGALTISAGAVQVTHPASLGATGAGTSVESGAVLDLNGIALGAEPLTLAGTGIASTTPGALYNSAAAAASVAGPVALAGANPRVAGFGDITISGVISDGPGATAWSKGGPNTLFLNAANTFTTGFTIAGGLVKVGDAAALGTTTGNTTINAGGVLDVNGFSLAEPITLSGVGIANFGPAINNGRNTLGALINSNATAVTLSGPLTLAANANVGSPVFTTGGDITLSGAVGGAFTLSKVGGNTLTFTSANTFNGTVVNSGKVIVSGAGTIPGFTINPGTTIDLDNTTTNVGNRVQQRGLVIFGGNFNLIGSSTAATTENLAANIVTFSSHYGVFTLVPSAGFGVTLTATSGNTLTRANNGTALIRGTNLGNAPGANVATFLLTGTIPTLGQAGAAGAANRAIVPWALVDTSATGVGTSFASHVATNGLRPLQAGEFSTSIVANNNIVLGADTSAAAGTTLVNSLTLNAGGSTLTIGAGNTLNLDSGGLLATSSWTISGGTLNSNANREILLHSVGAATNLTIASTLGNTTAGVTRSGDGTITFATPATFTGSFRHNAGTTTLAAGANTLLFPVTAPPALGALTSTLVGGNLVLNGGTLDLNGNDQRFNGFGANVVAGVSGLPGTSGTLTNTSATTATARFTQNTAFTVATAITGNLNLARDGGTTLTLTSPLAHTGTTTLNGGVTKLQDAATLTNTSALTINRAVLNLDNAQLFAATRLSPTTPITLRGGAITYFSRSGGTQEELNLGTVTIEGGASLIAQNLGGGGTGAVGSSTVNIANLVRPSAGAGLTFSTTANNNVQLGDNPRVFLGQVNGAPLALTNGILPPWLTVLSYHGASAAGGTTGTTGNIAVLSLDFATYDVAHGLRATNYTGAFTPTSNTNINAFTTLPAGGATTHALRLGNGAATLSFTDDADVLNVVSGGVISSVDNSARSLGGFAGNGRITAGGANPGGPRELFIYNAANSLTVNTRIIDNPTDGSVVSPVFSTANQAATIQLTAANTYTGTTYVNGAILTLNSASGPAIPGNLIAGGNTSNGTDSQNPVNQTIRLLAADQFAATSSVTLNGGTLLDLNGFTQTLANLTLSADGGSFGNQGAAVQTGATGALTLTGGITATNLQQATTIPVIVGNVTLAAGVHDVAIGAVAGAPGQIGLQINALLSGLGSLNVTSGMLGLGNQNVVDVNLAAVATLDVRGFAPSIDALSGAGAVTGTSTLAIGVADGSATFDGLFLGTLSLAKRGTGTQILTNVASTMTGAATIEGGVLQLSAPTPAQSVTGLGAIVVNGGGTVSGQGRATGGFVFNPGSRAVIAPAAAAPLTTVPTASISATAPVRIDLAGGPLAPGTYQLLDYGTTLPLGVFGAFSLGTTPGGGLLYGLLNDTANTAIGLAVETVQPATTWTGATNGVWDTTTTNWTTGTFVPGNQVVFDDTGANKSVSGGPVTPQAVTVTNSAGNDYTIANAITGNALGGVTKSGAGTLALTGANTFTGPIVVNGGTLRATVSSAGSGLGSGSLSFADGSTLILDPAASMAANGLTLRSFTGASPSNVAAIRDFNGTANFTGTSFTTGGVTTGNTNTAFYAGGPVDNFAAQWTGKVNITTPGLYSFFTTSDDGTRVFIAGRLVTMNDGSHGIAPNVGYVTRLGVGLHDLRIDYTEGTGGNEMNLRWQGPGIALAVVPSTAVFVAENAGNAGSTNNLVLGNNVTIPASMTLNLTGTAFTGVQVGALRLDPGARLVVGSAAGKQFRASATAVSGGTVTIDSAADVALGQLSDGGAATTIVKDGAGRLILDNTAPGGGASATVATTTIEVRRGELVLVGGIGQSAPAGSAQVRLDGGSLVLDSKGSLTAVAGVTTIPNGLDVLRSSTLQVVMPNGAPAANNSLIAFGTAARGVSLAIGTTLTIDVVGGGRSATALGNNFVGNGIVANAAGVRFDGPISGDGSVRLVSTPFNGGSLPAIGANGGATFTAANTYTGVTVVTGQFYNTPNVLNAAPLTLTLSGNGSILNTDDLQLRNARLTLDFAGTNLGGVGRLSDTLAVRLSNSVLQFLGSTTAASGETFGDLIANAGFNVATMANVNATNSTVLTANQLVRNNRAQLVAQGTTLGGALVNANLIRLLAPPTLVGGASAVGSGARDVGIVPFIVGTPAATGTLTWGLTSYDASTGSLRPLPTAEYTTLATTVTGANDNARDVLTAALALNGRQVNAYVLDNTSGAAQTATLNGTLGLGSGQLVLAAGAGTQFALTLTGGFVDFGTREGSVFVMALPGATLGSTLIGTQGLTVGGFGQLALTADNSATLAGPITLNGQLALATDSVLGLSTNVVQMHGGTLRFTTATVLPATRAFTLLTDTTSGFDTATGNSTIAGAVTGGGALAKLNANTLTLNNPSYTGATAIYTGGLVTTTTPQGDVLNHGTLTFTQATSGTYGGTITGNGAVVIASPGQTITLGDPNDAARSPNFYSNGTTVNSGSTLRGTTTSLVNAITAAASDAIVLFDQSFPGSIETTYVGGAGVLTKTGAGTVTLLAAQTNTGGVNVNAGTLALGASQRLADTTPLRVDGGTFALGANAETVGSVTLVSGSISGTTGVLSGTSFSVQSGTISAILGGAGALVKTTAGTVTLSGANTYGGPSNILAGTLVVNGVQSGAGTASVSNGATLAGNGALGGALTVQTGGTLDPGVGGAGMFTVAALQMNVGANFNAQIGRLGASAPVAGVDYDQVRVTGTNLDLGGATLNLTLAGDFVAGDIFTLLLNQGTDLDPGVFAGLANAQVFTQGLYEFQISYFDDALTPAFETVGGASVSVLVTVPEPGSLALLAVAAGLAGFRRRARR